MQKTHTKQTQTDQERERSYRILFPHVNPNQIKNGEERYMSTEEDARNTNRVMESYIGANSKQKCASLSIADAFACLGGNTYAFYSMFDQVTAYEIDDTRRTNLKTNITAYYNDRRNPVQVYANCLDNDVGITKVFHDVVFLDPPWLNPQTQAVDNYVFETVLNLCASIAQKKTASYVFLKLPLQQRHKESFEYLRRGLADNWKDMKVCDLGRAKKNGTVLSYTIVCVCAKNQHTYTTGSEHRLAIDSEIALSSLLLQLHHVFGAAL